VGIRLKLLVEGKTERDFVKEILGPYLEEQCGHMVLPVVNKTSTKNSSRVHRGGVSKYTQFKKNILALKEQDNYLITTMIDYYGLPADFPGMNRVHRVPTPEEKVCYLERQLKDDLPEELNFIPYIQLHEFEALLFSDIQTLDDVLMKFQPSHLPELHILRQQYSPEEINTQPETSPSHRLKCFYPNYAKVFEGIAIAKEIGLERMRDECPHFNEWIKKLEEY
jgi:hypothetical protein